MNILVVDDDKAILESFRMVLPDHDITTASDLEGARRALGARTFDAAFLDVRVGPHSGLVLLEEIKSKTPGTVCLMISGWGNVEEAVAAIRAGAYDFLEKPLSYPKVRLTLEHALAHRRLSGFHEGELTRYEMLGHSPALAEVRRLIDRAAGCDLPVLITGPSGSGKEHVAHLIHLRGLRGGQPMVKVNCAAIPRDLFESELFGSARGAFTGAVSDRRGRLEQASGGTCFLDELGELEAAHQAKLLRVLEDRQVTPVGADKPRTVDFRLIAATNRDLPSEIKEGRFREDLYYRIGVLVIHLPALSERREDIAPLAVRFLDETVARQGCPKKEFAPETIRALETLPLPGNVRELKNLVQRLVVYSDGPVIAPELLAGISSASPGHTDRQGGAPHDPTETWRGAKHRFEVDFLSARLAAHDGNISRAALSLGMLPNNLTRRLKALGRKGTKSEGGTGHPGP